MTTINIRIDEKLKKKASKTFADMGLDMSSAVKMFLSQTVLDQKIPFEVRTENGFTQEYEKEVLKEVNSVLKSLRSGKKKIYRNIKDLHKDLQLK